MTQSSITIEERLIKFNALMAAASPELVEQFKQRLLVSWIYHDSALEGVVYTPTELRGALEGEVPTDTSIAPIYEEIRQHRAAINSVYELASKPKVAVTLDVIRQFAQDLNPEDCDAKGPLYRKDMPLHRLYFHEIATPDKIAYKLRQLIDWCADPETKKGSHPIRLAAKAHLQLLQVYPFTKNSGKVSRLLMNFILIQKGYPPAIIHSTERQKYYEALKTSPNTVASIVHESLLNSVDSGIRFFGGNPLTPHNPAPSSRSSAGSRAAKASKAAKAARTSERAPKTLVER